MTRPFAIPALLVLSACTGGAPPVNDGPPVLDTGAPDCEDPTTFHEDFDLDGFGNPSSTREACVQPPGWVLDATDCDDEDDGTFPGAIEACDGVDRDCNGEVDDARFGAPRWHPDADEDGYGDDKTAVRSCSRPPGHVRADRGNDCDDADPAIFPGAPDAPCDGIDQDCSGESGSEAAQIGGRSFPAAQLALQASTAEAPVFLCGGDHRVTATLEHDLDLRGVGTRDQVRLRPLLPEDRILTVTADRLRLTGVTLLDGRGPGDGGAVSARVRVLEVEDVGFFHNRARLRGGALHVELADADDFEATLRNIDAVGNVAGRSGGALSFDLRHTGFVTLQDASFSGGYAGQHGGAVWLEGTDNTQVLSARRITGRDNHAAGRGGHIAVLGKRNAIFRGVGVDLRRGRASHGGLISLDTPGDGKIELSGCVLHDGTAEVAGGLVHHSGRFTFDSTLGRCDLSRGRAPEGGLQWLQTGTTAHLTWDDVDLHHGRADAGAGVWLTGTAAPLSGDLERVTVRDHTGAPAVEVDPDYLSAEGLTLVWSGGALLRNAAGAVSVPSDFTVELTGVDLGSGDDDNDAFDVRTGGSGHAWEGTRTVTCTDGTCE